MIGNIAGGLFQEAFLFPLPPWACFSIPLTGEPIMHKLCFALAVILISVASHAAASAGEPRHSFQPPSTRTVSGTEIVHFKNGPVPVDLSTTTIAALVPNGTGYNVLSGTGTGSGTFSIPNVPSGFYLLQIGAQYVWTSNTVVDADSIAAYRSDIVAANPNTTTVSFDLTNLHSWQATDILELACPNNNTFEGPFPGTVGETTFTGTFPYFGNLSVASEGDQYYVAQLITQNLGSYVFTGLGRYFAPAKFNQAQGSNTPIDGRLRTVTQNQKFEANINGADLTAQALAANPGAVLLSTSAGLSVYPGSFVHGQNTATTDLIIQQSPPFLTTNGNLGQVSYGDPYPSKWPKIVAYYWLANTSYTAPGATNSAAMVTYTYGITLNLPTASSPVKPLVGVVQNPLVNGKSFFTNQTGVGLTPILKWSPPSIGTASHYDVGVYQLVNNAGNTVIVPVAGFHTQGKSLRIPSGVLSAGQAYVFLVRPWYIPGVSFAKTPFINGSTDASADVTSGVMQP